MTRFLLRLLPAIVPAFLCLLSLQAPAQTPPGQTTLHRGAGTGRALSTHATPAECKAAVTQAGKWMCKEAFEVAAPTPPAPPASAPEPAASAPEPVVTWTQCATEWATCSFTGTQEVRFGTSPSLTGQYVAKTFSGTADCSWRVFTDPAPGKTKFCWVRGAAPVVTPPVVVPPVAEPPVVVEPPVVPPVVNPPSPSQPAGTVVYDGPGIAVPADFGCAHDTGYLRNNGAGLYHTDPNFNVRMNTMRLYGMGWLDWDRAEPSPGQFTWGPWDTALARLRDKAGVRTVIVNPYNVPAWANKLGAGGGSWSMQPVSAEVIDRWLTAVKGKVDQYGMKLIVEVSNESFSRAGGVHSQFWLGDSASLMALSNAILDWRKKHPDVKVWAPSVAAFRGNDAPYLNWMKSYPRVREFDAASIHLYFLKAEHAGKPTGPDTGWTAFVDIRDSLKAAGINLPIVDGEHGYAGGAVSPGTTFNYAVKALTLGMRQVCWFHLGSKDNPGGDTNLGEPYKNKWALDDLEAATALAGKTIVKVIKPNSGVRYWVQTK